MVAAGCIQKLQGHEGAGIGYTGWIRQKIHDNFWIVTYLGKKINIPLDKLETRRVFERPRLVMANKQMTEFFVFIQYITSTDKETSIYKGRCSRRSPDALRIDFTLNGIKNMEVLKHD